jgi:AcrR family transcriptional regulator
MWDNETDLVAQFNGGDVMDSALSNAQLVIIIAAQDIFARFGFKKTTMNDIARAAHKAKSSIYRYFKSKEEIFQTIVERESQILKEKIEKSINAQNNPERK